MRWILSWLLGANIGWASPMVIEDFSDSDAPAWQYVSDRVMGGVSDGIARFLSEDGKTFARLEGDVSTANNGGFIQIRRSIETLPTDAQGLAMSVRGNGEDYYVHLRPKGTRRPWQYFQASFKTSGQWEEITLDWSDFMPNGGLTGSITPDQIISIGIVAYGADYRAQLDLATISTW